MSCRDVDLHGDKLLPGLAESIIDHRLMINVSSSSLSLLKRVTLMSFGAPIALAFWYSDSFTPCVTHLHVIRS